MAKKATTLHDNLGNDLLPVTNASITYMDNGNSVQAEIQDLKEKTQYNKGHYTNEQDLLTAYPNNIENPQSRKGWYAIIGETDSVWIWDIEGNEWKDSGVSSGGVESVNGLDGEVILTGGNINATATINDTSKTELINTHLTEIYSELDNKVDLDSSQIITGTKVFTETIGLANTSEGTVDQIKHINSNFLITSGTGQNLLNIDEGLQTISAFNRELAYEDEIAEIQGNYVTNDVLNQEINELNSNIENYHIINIGEDVEKSGTYLVKDGVALTVLPSFDIPYETRGDVLLTFDIKYYNNTNTVENVILSGNYKITQETTTDELGLEVTKNYIERDDSVPYSSTKFYLSGVNAYRSIIPAISLNGESSNRTVSVYAPTRRGDNGQILYSKGSGEPEWRTPNYATEEYVQQNGGKIDSISVNGVEQTIDGNKNVNINVPTDYVNTTTFNQEIQNVTDMIPTNVSELANDSNYATQQYVLDNGSKIDTISVNGINQNISNKNVDISVPTNNNQLTNGAGYQTANNVNTLISNATQNMLTTNNYSSTLDNVYQQVGDYATTTDLETKQDVLNTTQLQAVNSGATSTNIGQIATNSNNINTINSKIPNQASSTNQLADKDFVNSSLNSITAFYITSNANGDPFSTKSALTGATTYYSGGQVATPTRNDYAIVLQDETKDNATTRYIYYNQWEYQYTVNETALTAGQLSAINSGITSTLVGKISSNEQMINSLAEQVVNDYVPDTRTINGKALSTNINLSASDVGAVSSDIPVISWGFNDAPTQQDELFALNFKAGQQDVIGKLEVASNDGGTNLVVTNLGGATSNLILQSADANVEGGNICVYTSTGNIMKMNLGTGEESIISLPSKTGVLATLEDIPDAPTINNGTLTIQKNGTSVGTFTANQSNNSTINITVPTGEAGDKGVTTTIDTSTNLPTSNAVKTFVEGKGYLTGITSSQVTSALGYTPYNATNPNGYVTSSGSVASATNATKLNNQDASYYLNYNNLSNRPTNYVTTDTAQTISGQKTFNNGIIVSPTTIPLGQNIPVLTYANQNVVSQYTSSDNTVNNIVIGNNYDGIAMQGSGARPTYNGSNLALSSDLGTQATFSLSGTTLTITPK